MKLMKYEMTHLIKGILGMDIIFLSYKFSKNVYVSNEWFSSKLHEIF